MIRKLLLLALATGMVGAVIAAANTQLQAREAENGATSLLVAAKTETAPKLTPELTLLWKSIRAVTVHTTLDEEAGPSVELRAMHDGEHIWILAQWKDETESVIKKRWEFNNGQWEHAKGDEDRIALAFNINSDAFAKEGCTSLCHEGKFHTTEADARVDMWHWKAVRGGMFSHVDDKHVISDPKDARKGDEGKGVYTDNKNEAGDGPKWIWKEDADTSGAFNADSARELPEDFKPEDGASVPSYLLRTPEGSRADIESRGKWVDGKWTVILKRKLDTGNDDDAQFKVGEKTTFTVSLFDDTGASTGDEHAVSEPCTIEIKE